MPCVCSVIDHRGHQNVVRTSVTHSAAPCMPLFCSYQILTSSVIYYWRDARQLGIYLLNSSCQYQNQKISLENKRSLKQSLRLKKKFSSFFRYRNIRNILIIIIILIITVIWLSVKYQNFFSFRNVTSPPHAVNVPFISSHRKVSRSSLEPNLSTWEFYFPCGLF